MRLAFIAPVFLRDLFFYAAEDQKKLAFLVRV